MTEIAPNISVDESVRFGRPVISGTRVPVDLVIAKLGACLSFIELGNEYGLTEDQIRAALAYAAESLSNERIRSVR
ncbi:MAG: DUF433 domain-containing protein [Acidobacteriota bacterium]